MKDMSGRDFILAAVLGIPFACIMIASFYVQWQSWQAYHRLGNYKIGLVTYFTQLQWPGVNFPGPNVLEAQIAAQPAEFRAYVRLVRRRMRDLRWAALLYAGFFFFVGFLVRNLSS
jgi:hypothetical protein